MIKLAPSILGKENKSEIVNKLINLGIEWIHYDVMDNKFVDNYSLPNAEIKEIISNTKKHTIDIHLMVKNPIEYFKTIDFKIDYCSMHFEEIENNISEFTNLMKTNNVKLGVVLNPNYNLSDIKSFIDKLSFVVVMGVQAGFGGQSFIENTILKVQEISNYVKANNIDCFIQVDGGMNPENIKKVVNSGASNIVVGSYLMKNISKEVIEKLIKIKPT